MLYVDCPSSALRSNNSWACVSALRADSSFFRSLFYSVLLILIPNFTSIDPWPNWSILSPNKIPYMKEFKPRFERLQVGHDQIWWKGHENINLFIQVWVGPKVQQIGWKLINKRWKEHFGGEGGSSFWFGKRSVSVGTKKVKIFLRRLQL